MSDVFHCVTLLLQEEAAERFAEIEPGHPSYREATVWYRYYARGHVAFGVSRKAFVPPPQVESAVLVSELRPPSEVRARAASAFAPVCAFFACSRAHVRVRVRMGVCVRVCVRTSIRTRVRACGCAHLARLVAPARMRERSGVLTRAFAHARARRISNTRTHARTQRLPLPGSGRDFHAFVRGCFAARRKMLRNTLAAMRYAREPVAAALSAAGLAEAVRPDEVALEEYVTLHAALFAHRDAGGGEGVEEGREARAGDVGVIDAAANGSEGAAEASVHDLDFDDASSDEDDDDIFADYVPPSEDEQLLPEGEGARALACARTRALRCVCLRARVRACMHVRMCRVRPRARARLPLTSRARCSAGMDGITVDVVEGFDLSDDMDDVETEALAAIMEAKRARGEVQ